MRNHHIQTVYSTFFRKLSSLHLQKERFTLSDGDFLNCYYLQTNKQSANTPLVILFHGLAGNYKSPYIQGMMSALKKNGCNSVVMHFRGCDGEDNLLPRSYHSGETGDAKEFLTYLKKKYPKTPLYAVGFSLGANMLLKLLGELKNDSLISKAVAISPPLELESCANAIHQGISRIYERRLVKDLNKALLKKYKRHDLEQLIGLKKEDVYTLSTFWEFDEAYTAPIHGFNSAQDYYTQCSSKQFLKDIHTDTLIIHAEDDPFMTPDIIPAREEVSTSITLLTPKYGGHVGFIGGNLLNPIYWSEVKVIEFLSIPKNPE